MAVSGHDPRPAFKERDWLGGLEPDETGPGDPCVEHGHRLQVTVEGLHPPHG
jgi:hypothetical protein